MAISILLANDGRSTYQPVDCLYEEILEYPLYIDRPHLSVPFQSFCA